jgi:hypothetical protein
MSVVATVFLTVVLLGADRGFGEVQLGPLKPGCRIEVRPTGGGTAVSTGAWLLCGEDSWGLLLAHPLNLVGRVEITTGAQALEYIRLFTSSRWHGLFPALKIIEVMPAESDGIYTIEAAKFRKHCREAVVAELPAADGKKAFQVTRTAVSLDDINLYEVIETVSETGYYELVTKRLVFKDATKLGMMIAGPM